MNKKILSYTPGRKQKHRVQGYIMEFGNFTRTTIMLLALGLSACQSIPPTQSELADSTTVENLNINMLDMGYSPSKLNVARAGRYQVKVSNTASIPHDIVFSNGVRVECCTRPANINIIGYS